MEIVTILKIGKYFLTYSNVIAKSESATPLIGFTALAMSTSNNNFKILRGCEKTKQEARDYEKIRAKYYEEDHWRRMSLPQLHRSLAKTGMRENYLEIAGNDCENRPDNPAHADE